MTATVPERLLQVTTASFCAGAVWHKINGHWACVHAAPILRWMVGMNPRGVSDYLTRKNIRWEWLPG